MRVFNSSKNSLYWIHLWLDTIRIVFAWIRIHIKILPESGSVTIFFRSLIRICINDTGTDPPHYATLWNKGLRYKALFFYYLPQCINRTAVAAAFRVLSVYVPPSTICFWRCSRRRRRAHFAQLRARRACGASGRVGATASDKCHSAPCHPVPTSSLKERGKFISSDGIEMADYFPCQITNNVRSIFYIWPSITGLNR